jgi:hypothetical protein
MKTAVEWLIQEWQILEAQLPQWLIEQVKQMEKEQMKDSYKQGFAYRDTWNWELDVDWDKDSTQENNQEFEQYYNETFGKTIVTEYRDGSIDVETFKS